MDNRIAHIVLNSRRKWIAIKLLEIFFLLSMASVLVFGILHWLGFDLLKWGLIATIMIVGLFVSYFLIRKEITERNVLRLFNQQYPELENSAELLLNGNGSLSLIEKLQQNKVYSKLVSVNPHLETKHRLVAYGLSFLILCAILIGVDTIAPSMSDYTDPVTEMNSVIDDSISENGSDTAININSLAITITPPSYTNLHQQEQNKWDVVLVEGSLIEWSIEFDQVIKEASLKFSNGDILSLLNVKESWGVEKKLVDQGYYELSYTDLKGNLYSTDFFKLEIVDDQKPTIEIKGISQYNEYDFGERNGVDFSVDLKDDYGIQNADITATIAKGSGESVRFREEKLAFDNNLKVGRKESVLRKTIHFDDMQMEPGDELYFYVEAIDNKTPSNRSRTETYFIVLRDTASYEFSLEGNLGVDLMPEYFRSQRQIIIDTEKLIANKSMLSDYEFNNTSNELGFDQKTLRLKYGQFMGEEDESGIAIQDDVSELEAEEESDSEESDNPLEEYMHDHDNENEHNLVDHEHELNEDGEEEEDPLEDFTHAHDVEEINTFLTNTIKGKLRAAMNLMWDAELYLRLFQPENSLPYQYKALKLIKEIKNHARIYVHRIGFDPPPIKEESRLSGELDEIASRIFKENREKHDPEKVIRDAISLLNNPKENWGAAEQSVLKNCGNELAFYAIENPGQYLNSLQLLRRLIEGDKLMDSELIHLIDDLYSLLSTTEVEINSQDESPLTIQDLFYQSLEEGGGSK